MRLNYSRNREPLICKNNRRATVFAAFLAVSPLACAPTRGEVRGVAGTKLVVMHEDTYRDLEARASRDNATPADLFALQLEVGRLIHLNTDLRERNSELDGEIARLRRLQKSDDYTRPSDRQQLRIAELYLASLGVRNPTYEDYRVLGEILRLQAIVREVTSPPLSAEFQKDEIKKNLLKISNGGSGILLSTDGYFITDAHVIRDNYYPSVYYDGRSYRSSCLCWNENFDTALCKMDMEERDFKPTAIRFAPLRKIRRGAFIEVLGEVDGNPYYQIGRIVNANADIILKAKPKPYPIYATVATDTYSKGGFSGGPIFLKDTGQLIGLTSYGDNLGAARIDHFLDLIKWMIDDHIKKLQTRTRQ